MKIIIPPAKKMNTDTDTFPPRGLPPLLDDTTILMEWLRCLTLDEAQSLWQCNEKIAQLNYQRLQEMDLRRNLTPALISYEGIQYQYMAPEVFTRKEWNYVQEHLRILSGFYGVLKPLDGVVPYRLEMQAKVKVNGTKNLYEFWDSKLYEEIHIPGQVILNLASKEYSKCIEKYLHPKDTFITCIFGEWKNNKVIQKGTMAKMARGEMVRFMAAEGIVNVEDIREFEGLGYHFEETLSDGEYYIFLRVKSFIDKILCSFESCFSRKTAFRWFVTITLGLMLRSDKLGVTSVICDLALRPGCYSPMLHFFRASS